MISKDEYDFAKKLETIGERIDLYMDHQEGNQPVRVLGNVTLFRLIHENSDISSILKWGVLEKGMFPEIRIEYGDDALFDNKSNKFRTPRIDKDKKLVIHETFLSIIWMLSYTMLVYYCDKYEHPKLQETNPDKRFLGAQERLRTADELFNYCRQIIVDFQSWDIEKLPNPEKYLVEELDYTGQAKMYFSEAVKFILFHEFIHVAKHIDVIEDATEEERLKFEVEADHLAYELLRSFNNAPQFVYECGAVIGIITNFIVSRKTKLNNHPNLEDRLKFIVEKSTGLDRNITYGFACVGIELWAKQFDHYLDSGDFNNHIERFYHYYNQLKKMK